MPSVHSIGVFEAMGGEHLSSRPFLCEMYTCHPLPLSRSEENNNEVGEDGDDGGKGEDKGR